ncbi:MAG: hypothetical protein HY738_00985 [Bacteroidia bacterium]|nr:hypothetical protein [Bacteroidia bacterium]
MQRYIEQLVEDIRARKNYVPKEEPFSEVYEEFEVQMMTLEDGPDTQLSKVFKLDKEAFPPADKLTNEQIETLVNEILSLWAAYNIEAMYPENVPPRILYPLLVEQLDKPFQYWTGWQMTMELCDYEPDRCPFGTEYCTCKDLIDEWEE